MVAQLRGVEGGSQTNFCGGPSKERRTKELSSNKPKTNENLVVQNVSVNVHVSGASQQASGLPQSPNQRYHAPVGEAPHIRGQGCKSVYIRCGHSPLSDLRPSWQTSATMAQDRLHPAPHYLRKRNIVSVNTVCPADIQIRCEWLRRWHAQTPGLTH